MANYEIADYKVLDLDQLCSISNVDILGNSVTHILLIRHVTAGWYVFVKLKNDDEIVDAYNYIPTRLYTYLRSFCRLDADLISELNPSSVYDCVSTETNSGYLLKFPSVNHWVESCKGVTIRVGRWLRSHLADNNDMAVKEWTAIVRSRQATLKVEFHKTQEMVNLAYETGPSSCMQRDYDHLKGAKPYHVYINDCNDIGIAICRVEGDEDGIYARALVNLRTKTYGAMYAKTDTISTCKQRFKDLLEAEGYEYNYDWCDGEQLNYIEVDGAVVLPYIDPSNIGAMISMRDKTVIAGSSGQGAYSEANYESGCAGNFDHPDYTSSCADCERYCRDDDLTSTYSGEYVCESCLQEYTWAIVDTGGEREYVSDYSDYLVCAVDGKWVYTRNITNYERLTSGQHNGEYAHTDDVYACESGETFHQDDVDDGDVVYYCDAYYSSDYYALVDDIIVHKDDVPFDAKPIDFTHYLWDTRFPSFDQYEVINED